MNKIKIDVDAKWQIFDIIPTTFGFSLDASKEPCDTREIAEEKLNKALKRNLIGYAQYYLFIGIEK